MKETGYEVEESRKRNLKKRISRVEGGGKRRKIVMEDFSKKKLNQISHLSKPYKKNPTKINKPSS